MKRATNILVIVDPTATTHPALNKASQLAKQLGARLELFICDYRAGLEVAAAAGAREVLLQHRREALEALAVRIRQNGVDVTVSAAFDNPLHEGLLRKIASSHADLVIKDTHYHNLVRRTLITNTDWHLIRSCRTPLLLVKPTHWSSALRTLAAVDPVHTSDKSAMLDREVCEWSVTLANAMQGEGHAVHMYLPSSLLISAAAAPGSPMSAATGIEQNLIEEERQLRLKAVQEITAPLGIPAERTRLMLGTAVELLAEEAERVRADIVVMGAVSRSRLKQLFVGNTAERVLDHLPCDVLIVKPLDFATDLPF
jgi:universal stress protein E